MVVNIRVEFDNEREFMDRMRSIRDQIKLGVKSCSDYKFGFEVLHVKEPLEIEREPIDYEIREINGQLCMVIQSKMNKI